MSDVEVENSESDGDVADVLSEAEDSSDVQSEESDESPQVVRRSSRAPISRKVFTYDELGGNPVREEIT